MKNAIDFIEKFIEQRSTATLAEYKQVLSALADLRKFVEEGPRSGEKPAGRVPYPGSVADED